MEDALISVIVPVYNAETTLARCIESILSQTYTHLELILVNDGAKDNSLSICQAYALKDQRVKVIDIPNGGVSNARNTAILQCQGAYITFVDSDDYIEINYLKELYNNRKESFLTLCAFKNVYVNKEEYFGFGKESLVQLDTSFFGELFNGKLLNSPCNKIYDVSVLKRHHLLFDSRYYLGEDLLFNLEYMKKINLQGFIVINNALTNYTVNNTPSLSKMFKLEEIEMQTLLYKEVIAFVRDYLNFPHIIPNLKEGYYYALLYRFDGMYKANKGKWFNKKVRETIKENDNTSLKEILKISKNRKLKIKLLVAYYLGFDVYYQLFGYK